MKHSKDPNFRFCHFVEHSKRESANNGAPDVLVNFWILLRIVLNPFHGFIDAEEELRAEPLSLVVVPLYSVPELAISLWVIANVHVAHSVLRNSDLMSCQVRPCDGLALKDCERISSSSF